MSDKETALLLVLARGGSVSEAALASGLSERTVFRRLNNPDFRLAVSRARSEMLADACGQLADQAIKAAKKLTELMSGKSEQVQLGAARAILEIGPRLHEGIELAEQIRLLREEVEALKSESEMRFRPRFVEDEQHGTNNKSRNFR